MSHSIPQTDPAPHLPQCPEGHLALGLRRLCLEDPALAQIFLPAGGIKTYELEALLTGGSLSHLTLAVLIDAVRERSAGANYTTELETTIALGLVVQVGDREGTGRFFAARLFNHIKALIARQDHEIRHDGVCAGFWLRYEQPPPVLIGTGSMLLYVLRCVFQQAIHAQTRKLK